MYLQLVNRRQAGRLRQLGFHWKVRDIFIPFSGRSFMEESMNTEEDWNAYEYTISRPSIAVALQWVRIKFNCRCEVMINDWKTETYWGAFQFDDMQQIVYTRIYREREWAESELLTKILQHKLNIKY